MSTMSVTFDCEKFGMIKPEYCLIYIPVLLQRLG
jgi:hypothetical protein